MTEQQRKELTIQPKKEAGLEGRDVEGTRLGPTFLPTVDIFESSEMITLRADIPGVRKEDVDIDLRDGVLTLVAPVPLEPEAWRPLHREHRVGSYRRRFTLGERIAQDQISAQVDHGVLTVRLPKSAAHRPRRIDIQ